MDAPSDATLHRVEVLPGDDRYAVTFRQLRGSELTATVRLGEAGLEVAAAGLPAGWRPGDEAFDLLAATVRALAAATSFAPAPLRLVDVAGGWDVSLGNVVLGADERPQCTAHGPLAPDPAVGADGWSCAECGARAVLHR